MKKLFNQLMPFLNRKYFNGRMIRWMIEDANGRSVSCFCCGNIANAIGEVKLMGWLFRLPVCKAHIRSYFAGRTDAYSFSCPGVFPMNIVFRYPPAMRYPYSMQRIIGEPIQKVVFNLGFDLQKGRDWLLNKSEELSLPVFLIDPIEDEAKNKAAIFRVPWHNGPILGAADVLNPLPFWCGDECDGGPTERCNRQCFDCKGEAHYMEWPHWKWCYRNVESLKK